MQTQTESPSSSLLIKPRQAGKLLLQAVIDAGWIITGSWPIDTERGSGSAPWSQRHSPPPSISSADPARTPMARCAPTTWANGETFLRNFPSEFTNGFPGWRMRASSVPTLSSPASAPHWKSSHAIPGSNVPMALRFRSVNTLSTSGPPSPRRLFPCSSRMPTPAGLEPDARLTAMWLWTLRTEADDKEDKEVQEVENEDEEDEKSGKSPAKGGFVLEFDAARKIAQGLGANLEELRVGRGGQGTDGSVAAGGRAGRLPAGEARPGNRLRTRQRIAEGQDRLPARHGGRQERQIASER